MRTSIGRIVLYNLTKEQRNFMSAGGTAIPAPENATWERAAMIVKCKSSEEDAPVNLFVFDENGQHTSGIFVENAVQGYEPGKWHEPKKV